MKLPRIAQVTRIEAVEEPELAGRFSEIVIVNGAKEVRLHRDVDSDELRFTRGLRRKRRGVISILSGRFRVEWLWAMTNQQGYSDGVRLQLCSKSERLVFEFIAAASAIDVFEATQRPNKAPEPTTTAVMPRATLPVSDVKQRTENRNPARVTPAVVVAHL